MKHVNKILLGTWELEGFQIITPEKEKRNWGEEMTGLLIYSATGHMSVSISKKLVGANDTNKDKVLLDSFIFYAGTYSIQSKEIVHYVSIATNQDRKNKEMRRFFKIKEDLLTLSSPEQSFGKAVLKWRKIKH